MGRFGFILHGLWPDAAGRRDPRWCRPVPLPDPATIRANLCVTPSADLLAHVWAKHGSCRFSDAPRYFRAASVMFDVVRFPDMARMSRRTPTAGGIRRAFVARKVRNSARSGQGVFVSRNFGGLAFIKKKVNKINTDE